MIGIEKVNKFDFYPIFLGNIQEKSQKLTLWLFLGYFFNFLTPLVKMNQ